MSTGGTALRRQIADLRALVIQAAALHGRVCLTQDEDSVAWAERVSGLALDAWQQEVLLAEDARLAILCCRQSGKSTIVALKAADLVRQGGMAVVVAPILRQSSLLFRTLNQLLITGGESFRRETATELETTRGGLALCLPGDRPDMLRGLSLRWPTTSLLIVDEAARVREIDVVGDLTDAGRGADSPAGALEHASRCCRRVSSCHGKRRSWLAADHHSGGGLQPHRAGFPRPRAHPARRRAVSARVSLRVHRFAWFGIFGRNPERDVRRSRRTGM